MNSPSYIWQVLYFNVFISSFGAVLSNPFFSPLCNGYICQAIGNLDGAIWRIIINNYYLVRDLLKHVSSHGNSFSMFSFSFQVVVTIDTPVRTISLASKEFSNG
jgi:hypothetical protein